jgi:hypothetical protein
MEQGITQQQKLLNCEEHSVKNTKGRLTESRITEGKKQKR